MVPGNKVLRGDESIEQCADDTGAVTRPVPLYLLALTSRNTPTCGERRIVPRVPRKWRIRGSERQSHFRPSERPSPTTQGARRGASARGS